MTHQVLVDVDGLIEEGPYDCFVAFRGGQGAHVPIEHCAVNVANQVVNRDV